MAVLLLVAIILICPHPIYRGLVRRPHALSYVILKAKIGFTFVFPIVTDKDPISRLPFFHFDSLT